MRIKRSTALIPSKPPTPPQGEVKILGFSLNGFIAELRKIAEQADKERLSVLIDGFRQDFPELYDSINELVDLPPGEVIKAITKRWPLLNVIYFYQDRERLIEMIQTEIKLRKKAT